MNRNQFPEQGMFRIQEEPKILRNERELWKKNQQKTAMCISTQKSQTSDFIYFLRHLEDSTFYVI